MTAKEKADQLVAIYRNVLINEDTDCACEILCTTIAKQNAIIAVDLVIDTNPYSTSLFNFFPKLDYWHRVREEIDKI
jgi:hypothetical protein